MIVTTCDRSLTQFLAFVRIEPDILWPYIEIIHGLILIWNTVITLY